MEDETNRLLILIAAITRQTLGSNRKEFETISKHTCGTWRQGCHRNDYHDDDLGDGENKNTEPNKSYFKEK